MKYSEHGCPPAPKFTRILHGMALILAFPPSMYFETLWLLRILCTQPNVSPQL
jgi:hypothetical protein